MRWSQQPLCLYVPPPRQFDRTPRAPPSPPVAVAQLCLVRPPGMTPPDRYAYSRALAVAFGSLAALYAAARAFQILPGKLPMVAVVALHVLPLLIFALIHGAILYRLTGILIFFAICLVVGNAFENLGVSTGFPFGRYYFTDAMGPKLFQVPILLGLAYVGMGYLSWTLGRVILGNLQAPLAGARTVALPLVAAFIMVAWDFANDPVWANINRLWIWQHGGAYFGVPLTNFLGWYLVVYVIYQLFALYLRGRSPSARRQRHLLSPQPGPYVPRLQR